MNETLQRIEAGGVVAVLRGVEADQLIDIAAALQAGGVTAIEVTADTPGVADLIDDVAGSFEADEAAIGAGTVLDAETARAVTMAGAEFVVSPSCHTDVIESCNRYGIAVAPGVMTPTEAVEAYEAGADFVKVFPASTVGPGHVAALNGPLGHIPMMATGGIDIDNAGAFIEAGCELVGAGSALVDYDAAERGDFDAITDRAEAFTRAVRSARE